LEINSGPPSPADVTAIDLRSYQEYLQKNRKPATVNRRMVAVKQWLFWAREKGMIERMPNFPKRVAEQKGQPKALSKAEQNRLLREVERRGKIRDIALVRLLMSCGLRVGELVSIKLDDLDIGERHGTVRVLGKGNKYREVPVPPEARKVLQIWLEERKKKHPDSEWLFSNRNGGHLSARYVEKVIENFGRFAGFNVHPHMLRHTMATNMLRSGTDLVVVADILGHANIATTAVYTRPGMADKARAVEGAEM
jgi:integrase/recombinase XerC